MEHSPEVKEYCARVYMEHVRSLAHRVSTLEEEVDTQRARLTGLVGIKYGERVSSSSDPDKMADMISQLHGAISEYVTELSEFIAEQDRAHKALLQIPAIQSRILTGYYLQLKPWAIVADEVHYSERWVRGELRTAALVALYDVMPEEWRRSIPRAL